MWSLDTWWNSWVLKLLEIQLFRYGRKSVYHKGNAWICYWVFDLKFIGILSFFIRKLMSTWSFQSWSLLPVNLNSIRKDGEVHSMLYYCQVFNTVCPQKYWEDYVVFILGCHFPFWFLYHFICCVHRGLVCFSPQQLLCMWWTEYLDPH